MLHSIFCLTSVSNVCLAICGVLLLPDKCPNKAVLSVFPKLLMNVLACVLLKCPLSDIILFFRNAGYDPFMSMSMS